MKRAFTIIELLVVIGIIGILMGTLLSVFSGSSESARAAKCESNMHNLAMAVQSVGMSSGYYPRASTMTYTDSDGQQKTVHSWLGDETDPYVTGESARRECFDNGTIWSVMGGNRDAYVCPSHKIYAKEHGKGDPLWSYQMNSYFDIGANVTKQRKFGRWRADRYLLFAELPYAKMTVGAETIQKGSASGAALDPKLDRGSEVMGFNHKEGKNVVGHVCFADGHVEKLRAPNDSDNIKDLTKWLCCPTDKSGDFDIRFDGKTYEKDTTKASTSAE